MSVSFTFPDGTELELAKVFTLERIISKKHALPAIRVCFKDTRFSPWVLSYGDERRRDNDFMIIAEHVFAQLQEDRKNEQLKALSDDEFS